ncbi:hypothetical protein Q8F55_004075 [Vanrija albida]|uniref:MARVEL domain-containing protein n=1 Tax=Vanrija albida TaxID=181172 RepID=A0ABR3Q6C7_9TREE
MPRQNQGFTGPQSRLGPGLAAGIFAFIAVVFGFWAGVSAFVDRSDSGPKTKMFDAIRGGIAFGIVVVGIALLLTSCRLSLPRIVTVGILAPLGMALATAYGVVLIVWRYVAKSEIISLCEQNANRNNWDRDCNARWQRNTNYTYFYLVLLVLASLLFFWSLVSAGRQQRRTQDTNASSFPLDSFTPSNPYAHNPPPPAGVYPGHNGLYQPPPFAPVAPPYTPAGGPGSAPAYEVPPYDHSRSAETKEKQDAERSWMDEPPASAPRSSAGASAPPAGPTSGAPLEPTLSRNSEEERNLIRHAA